MTSEARVAIQMTHRLGAFIVLLAVGWLAFRLVGPLRWALAGVLIVQFGLGVANVLAQLPLAVATLHNAGAALLLLALITVYAAASGASRQGQLDQEAPDPGTPDDLEPA
jgi:cytochrome c oxidase assembly protein subunit 15